MLSACSSETQSLTLLLAECPMMHIREVKIVTLSSNVPTDHIERKLFFIGLSCKSLIFFIGLVSFFFQRALLQVTPFFGRASVIFFIGLSCKSLIFFVDRASVIFFTGLSCKFPFFHRASLPFLGLSCKSPFSLG